MHYRKYCTLRIQRLRKSLKITNGKGKYQKRVIAPEDMHDARHLELILIQAERAWALAMELKELWQADPDLNARLKFHARSRLVKV